jgi:hypothetical protein
MKQHFNMQKYIMIFRAKVFSIFNFHVSQNVHLVGSISIEVREKRSRKPVEKEKKGNNYLNVPTVQYYREYTDTLKKLLTGGSIDINSSQLSGPARGAGATPSSKLPSHYK